jgi:Glycosyltransferase
VPVLVIGTHSGGRWVSDADIKILMNRHQFHVMPSMYEGYGQVLHEAMSAEQVIITTDAPPMNEIGPVILVPSVSRRPHHAGILHTVTPFGVQVAVRLALQLSAEQIAWHRFGVREQYEREERQFRLNLNDVLKEAEL